MFSLFYWSSCPTNPVYGLCSCISSFLFSSRVWTLFCIGSSDLSIQDIVVRTSIFIQHLYRLMCPKILPFQRIFISQLHISQLCHQEVWHMVNQHLLPYIKVPLMDTNQQVIPPLLLFIQVSVLRTCLVISMTLRLFLPLFLTWICSQYWSMRIFSEERKETD
jgi:hypothetical protein